MNSVNVNIPVVNMPAVSHQQSDAQRAPVVHQQQNSDEERDRFDRQMKAPAEADQAEGRIVDAKDEKKEKHRGRKKSKQQEQEEDGGEVLADTGGMVMSENGRFLDLKA
ncbi:MAG: hypothetical protein LBI42_12955 [Chitinispirillales bacterium]|nr:hypothetical protein [Chitinispirillales bacterium]